MLCLNNSSRGYPIRVLGKEAFIDWMIPCTTAWGEYEKTLCKHVCIYVYECFQVVGSSWLWIQISLGDRWDGALILMSNHTQVWKPTLHLYNFPWLFVDNSFQKADQHINLENNSHRHVKISKLVRISITLQTMSVQTNYGSAGKCGCFLVEQ